MVRGGPIGVAPGHLDRPKLELAALQQPRPASASPPAAANSDTGVPNFLMALLRRNRR
jgi:hypothetical protein